MNCPDCRTAWTPRTLACPGCRRLVHGEKLTALAAEAEALEASDANEAIARWTDAFALLPIAAAQRAVIQGRIERLAAEPGVPTLAPSQRPVPKWLAAFGAAGVLLWKAKFLLVLLLSKGKLLLLGLTKWKTAFSMLVFLGVYWAAFGWPFALGIVLSLYVHEMGHVAELRRRGIAASAPMFIPGLGAFVRLRQAPRDSVEDARIGLAGPWWGLAAALISLALYFVHGGQIFLAIARVGGWINLFNLIPLGPLDGGRAFRSLTRKQRLVAAGALVVAWVSTEESLLLLLIGAALYRAWAGPFDKNGDARGLTAYVVLLFSLSALLLLHVSGIGLE